MGVELIRGDNFVTARLADVVNWARKSSLWPFPFGTACCGIEMMSTLASRYDMARFGAEAVRFSPRQADLLIVAGTICNKMAPVLKRIYDQMSQPKWVIAMGACASCGGIFDNYTVVQGIDQIIPVDMYVPGCPPSPQALMYSFTKIQGLVQSGQGLSLDPMPEAVPSVPV
ncbi:NADH-quinone oxidoreductase subunit B [bacterium]|nr:NADH-quinone oxidoreductase subunit B [bacterium]